MIDGGDDEMPAEDEEMQRTSKKNSNVDFKSDVFCQKDIREHTGCVNALRFSHGEQLLATGGDDLQSRIWKVDELMLRKNPKPDFLAEKRHTSNIFSLEFDLEDRFIYSGEHRGAVYKHDIQTNQVISSLKRSDVRSSAYNMDHHPSDSHLLAVTFANQVCFLDNRDFKHPIQFKTSRAAGGGDFYSAEFHPESPVLMLLNAEDGGPNVFDRRNPSRPVFLRNKFNGIRTDTRGHGYMGATWSPSGNQFMVLRKLSSPLYFDFQLISQRCFTLKPARNRNGYLNMKTIKSMIFIDDYTVATGSDHWGIHLWQVPRAHEDVPLVGEDRSQQYIVEKEIRVLRGHRSIPNQLRFSKHNQILVSSGVENSFKIWSNRRLPWSYDIPFVRKKNGEYDGTMEEEQAREKEERRILEDALDRDSEMEGRASYDDVFGGNDQTSEQRDTLEHFDVDEDEMMYAMDDEVDSDEERVLMRRGINEIMGHFRQDEDLHERILHMYRHAQRRRIHELQREIDRERLMAELDDILGLNDDDEIDENENDEDDEDDDDDEDEVEGEDERDNDEEDNDDDDEDDDGRDNDEEVNDEEVNDSEGENEEDEEFDDVGADYDFFQMLLHQEDSDGDSDGDSGDEGMELPED
ncbi:hypothetical protein CRE_27147 [Caenorhabditis remanei]|uniref:Uncharacterized protein n=1 Tax=Caenorhabditis remanei TaxID=31234 RepID=E3LNQ3_CAERE|nr:hypothetical protein CRE_27147 [Caenorhabditis remanei]